MSEPAEKSVKAKDEAPTKGGGGLCNVKTVLLSLLLVPLLGYCAQLMYTNTVASAPSVGIPATPELRALEAGLFITRDSPGGATLPRNLKLDPKLTSSSATTGFLFDDVGMGRIKAGIKGMVEYVIRNNDGNGFFGYQWMLQPDGEWSMKKEYNVLRHSGTVYALADACGVGSFTAATVIDGLPCQEARQAMIRAADWVIREAIGVVPGSEGKKMAVYSQLRVENPKKFKLSGGKAQLPKGDIERGKVKLGAIGLTLVALSSVAQLHQESGDQAAAARVLGVVDGLCNFLIEDFTQPDTGLFHLGLKFDATGMRPDPDATTIYYPGEAALGLVFAFEASGNQRYLDAAFNALLALSKSRAHLDPRKYPSDHWALIATASVLDRVKDRPEEAEIITTHAANVCSLLLRKTVARYQVGYAGNAGMGTMLEGLFAILPYVEDRNEILPVVGNEMGKPQVPLSMNDLKCLAAGFSSWVVGSQSTIGPAMLRGGLPARFSYKDTNANMPGTDTQVHAYMRKMSRKYQPKEYRIDYTQHGMSGIIAILRAREKLKLQETCTALMPQLSTQKGNIKLLPTVMIDLPDPSADAASSSQASEPASSSKHPPRKLEM